MKIKSLLVLTALTGALACAWQTRASDITATGSGNWSSTVPDAPWPGGVIPGTNDSVDVESPFTVTVDGAQTIGYIYGGGTVTMAPNSTLTVLGDNLGAYGTQDLQTLNATAAGSTVIYMGNVFWAKRTDYFNLVFLNITTNAYDFYNGNIPGYGAQPMSIGGNLTLSGKVKVQQGADFTVGGNLWLGTNSSWDCSSFNLTVSSNTLVDGLLLDLDGALGVNYFGGSVTISSLAIGWNISDVIQWSLGGSLTNNGNIVGKGYGSISFDGSGVIAGTKTIKIPTMSVSGTYTIANSITLITNTPTLSGTLIFDLARTNQITLLTNAGTALFYSGNLTVVNSGGAVTPGTTYKLFNAPSYDGAFDSITYPAGASFTDNLLTSGSIVSAGIAPPPVLNFTRNGNNLILSWDSTTYPGYSVKGQTNGLASNGWSPTGSGTVSPWTNTINPANAAVFYRLSKP
ncbi:MAG: hypothetical protein U1F98_15845 [Verrucomicrobiota bacterium]